MDAGGTPHATPPVVPGEGGIVKRIRKGTKSCVECRQRKIRCVWNSPQDAVCVGCKARGRDCVPQLYRRTTNAPRLSAKERISRLEQQIAHLTSGPREDGTRPTSGEMSPQEDGHSDEEDDVSSDDDLDNHFSNQGPAPEGPVHLQFLFDSGRVNRKDDENESSLEQARVSKRYLDQARTKLQRHLPPRDEVQNIADYAGPWMAIYLALFPSTTAIASKEDILFLYESVVQGDAHPMSIAMFLLVFSVTCMQVPGESVQLIHGKDKFSFARGVVHAVETVIVSHTGLSVTIEGIEVAVMFLRLKLTLGGVRNLWLALRRTIALAELIGLPRAWHLKDKAETSQVASPASTTSSTRDRLTQKAALWQAICATDRLASLMFNLPAGTSMHKFPRKRVVSPDGGILPREYMFELATVALAVQELDEAYSLEAAHEDVYERVLARDRYLRSIKNSMPKGWWTEYTSPFSALHLTRFWHHYMVMRVHLPWALKEDGDEYAYSHMTCTEASEHTCQRYCQTRRAMPSNFFICRIMDMQVFTAAAFLTLLGIKQQQQGTTDVHQQTFHLGLVQQVLDTWKLYTDGITAPFLKEATSATETLVNILQDPTGTAARQNLSLRIPLLGRVRFGRQEPQSQQARQRDLQNQLDGQLMNSMSGLDATNHNMPAAGTAYPQHMSNQTFDAAMANTMPWLMQLDMNTSSLQDPFFGAEELGSFDMWSSGMESMPAEYAGNIM